MINSQDSPLPGCARAARATRLGAALLLVLLVPACLGDRSIDPSAVDASGARPQGTGHVFHVNPEGTGDFPTIQAALDAVEYGDEILLAPGRYTWTNQGTGTGYGLFFVRPNTNGFLLKGEEGADHTFVDAEGNGRCVYMTTANDDAVIEGITFTGGNAFASTYGYRTGGGVTIHMTSPTFRDCIFADNVAETGGGFATAGETGSLLEGCVFRGNTATRTGGGAFLHNSGSTVRFVSCSVYDNLAGETGGGLSSRNVPMLIEHTEIWGNRADQSGAAIALSGVPLATVVRSTIVKNYAPELGQIRNAFYSNLEVESSIVAFGGGAEALFTEDGSDSYVACSDIFGNAGGDGLGVATDGGGNFSLDPLFVDPDANDYRLLPTSPCAPGKHPGGEDCGRIGAYDPLRYAVALSR
ncbi:MAG: right-handed parallel beta-helix repeat-containing protein [Candidatus Eisenbacteria bacterium]